MGARAPPARAHGPHRVGRGQGRRPGRAGRASRAQAGPVRRVVHLVPARLVAAPPGRAAGPAVGGRIGGGQRGVGRLRPLPLPAPAQGPSRAARLRGRRPRLDGVGHRGHGGGRGGRPPPTRALRRPGGRGGGARHPWHHPPGAADPGRGAGGRGPCCLGRPGRR